MTPKVFLVACLWFAVFALSVGATMALLFWRRRQAALKKTLSELKEKIKEMGGC